MWWVMLASLLVAGWVYRSRNRLGDKPWSVIVGVGAVLLTVGLQTVLHQVVGGRASALAIVALAVLVLVTLGVWMIATYSALEAWVQWSPEDDEGGGGGGGGGGRPPDAPEPPGPDGADPAWWKEFERDLREWEQRQPVGSR